MIRAVGIALVLTTILVDASSQDETSYGDSIGLEFVVIEPGTFRMGSTDGDWDELPVHTVTISRSYELGVHEVTQVQWFAVMGTTVEEQLELARQAVGRANFQSLRGIGDDHPMYLISWTEAQEFIARLNRLDAKYEYRLPTEAEWEYSARAGSTTAYSFGDDMERLSEYAWYRDNADSTHPVGGKRPNAWGLYDMHGNVWEWVEDYSGRYGFFAVVDPTGPRFGESRTMRGGGWGNPAKSQRSSHRTGNDESSRSSGGIGMRLLRMREE